MTTKIEWTDETWNPVVGCSVISPGCTNCYAMRLAARLERMGTAHYAGLTAASKAGPVWTGKVALAPERVLTAPLHWREPRRVFVDSMGDLFHEAVPDAAIDKVFAVMALAERHTFQVLTKRSARMRAYVGSQRSGIRDQMESLSSRLGEASGAARADSCLLTSDTWPLPNVWLGVSAEDQARADERVPDLLDTPAAVRFVSAEPLLGPIDFTRLCLVAKKPGSLRAGIHLDALRGRFFESGVPYSDSGLDQVIVGGESGPGARPMQPAWARSIRDQCVGAQEARSGDAATGTDKRPAFFFKQWGAWAPDAPFENIRRRGTFLWPDGRRPSQSDLPAMMTCDYDLTGAQHMTFIGKTKAGRLLDGREWNETP